MIKIAVVGLGHWGPNYLRVFSQLDQCRVVACVDSNPARFEAFQRNYPSTHFYTSLEELYQNEQPEATVIATPTTTHFAVAKMVLDHGQHILIEKPLATSEQECAELSELAKKQKRLLMVGHTFLYNDAINWMKNFLKEGNAGKMFYLYAVRTNLGPIRQDVNALMDLAPHDVSVFLYLTGQKAKAVSAQGVCCLNHEREDVSFLTIYFEGGALGHIHVSWLDPRKVRQTTVIGDKKMVVFDDMTISEPVRIYDKGVRQPKDVYDFTEFKTVLYDGDVVIPKVQMGEPLKNQCKEFLNCLEKGRAPYSDGAFATDVTRVLAGAMKSLKQKGEIVSLS